MENGKTTRRNDSDELKHVKFKFRTVGQSRCQLELGRGRQMIKTRGVSLMIYTHQCDRKIRSENVN
jgi:hypothetical protein